MHHHNPLVQYVFLLYIYYSLKNHFINYSSIEKPLLLAQQHDKLARIFHVRECHYHLYIHIFSNQHEVLNILFQITVNLRYMFLMIWIYMEGSITLIIEWKSWDISRHLVLVLGLNHRCFWCLYYESSPSWREL